MQYERIATVYNASAWRKPPKLTTTDFNVSITVPIHLSLEFKSY